jgi:hypothetical protein
VSGFHQAWVAYLCAMHGHVWEWASYYTGGEAPAGASCSRCGAVKS